MKRNRTAMWIAIVAAVLMVLGGGCCMMLGLAAVLGPTMESMGDAVAVVEVEGIIASGSATQFISGMALTGQVISDLEKAENDDSVGAIVLYVNSPGGTVVASAEIYEALTECSKPVVTSMGEIAASGGYYIACGTEYIMAHPASIVGSIGVISQYRNAEELFDKLGIETQVIKSGARKDHGGWHRPLTPDEVAMHQAMIDQAYADFVGVIIEGREMEEDEVLALADGSVFSGTQAVQHRLVDASGNLDDAIATAARMVGIEGEPRVVRYPHEPSFIDILGGYLSRASQPQELLLFEALLGMGSVPKLQYLYVGP